MGVLTRVGRKRPIARLGLGCLFLVLLIGAVTTLFPFLVMVSTGLIGPTDQNENNLIPSYFTNDPKLLEKFVDDKYSGNLDRIASPRTGGSHQAQDFGAFLESLPP
jgi:multiple sugar transport system permease protein